MTILAGKISGALGKWLYSQLMDIRKILIANRGEIALRVMRTAREMGIRTVAVYSEADRGSLHVRHADEAFCIGPAPSAESYLRIDKIIETARQAGADAIHPGYGFLSENPEFARAVEEAGLIFIGPPAKAMKIMGSKLAAREAVAGHGIPLVPGSPGPVTDFSEAREIARQIGYPVLVKASAGGGGKGMRVVPDETALQEALQLAAGEAKTAFGDPSVYLEKYLESPRHIEFQILADRHGNVVHLFERECSIQRRHQKVIEESPSAIMTPELRDQMGRSAIAVARACGYTGAGTVEFLVDKHLNYYFLEMNTRLQVEHPVTEFITGLDLVREQIRVARGEPLGYAQEDLSIHGHAIELRVYAENPKAGFVPDTGTLELYQHPAGPGIRVDDGFEQGMQIPIYYDPMIAKLVVHASDRAAAIDKMLRAIEEYQVGGVETTLPFGRFVMLHEAFRSGQFDTHFVEQHFDPDKLYEPDEKEARLAALLSAYLHMQEKGPSIRGGNLSPAAEASSPWRRNRQEKRGG